MTGRLACPLLLVSMNTHWSGQSVALFGESGMNSSKRLFLELRQLGPLFLLSHNTPHPTICQCREDANAHSTPASVGAAAFGELNGPC